MRRRPPYLIALAALTACSASTTVDGGALDSPSAALDLGSDVGISDARVDALTDAPMSTDSSTISHCGGVACATGFYCCNWGCGMDCRPTGAVCMGDCPADAGARYCGGLGGPTCGTGEFCNYPVSEICGAADGSGVCTVPPTSCDTVYAPVCGCDGRGYANECMAAAAGTSVRSVGTCPAPDCNTTGCPPGSSCQACLGAMGVEYVCIGAGAAC